MTKKPSAQMPSWLVSSRHLTKLSQLWQVPTFLVGVLALVMVCSGAVVQHQEQKNHFVDNLKALRRQLDAADADLVRWLPTAKSLVEEASSFPGLAGEAHLLLGSTLAELADRKPAGRAEEMHKQALHHLRRAEALGVPLRDRLKLWFHLGKVLYHTGADPKLAVNYLNRSLPKGARLPAEGYGLLAQAYLKLPIPDVDAALIANEQQIKLTNDESILMPARLLRGELFMRKKQYYEALRVLERIGAGAPTTIRRKAAYLEALACTEEGLWSKAAPLWEKLVDTPEIVPGGRKHIYYTLGKCYRHSTPPDDAKARRAWKQAQKAGGEEGQAATLHLAEMALLDPQPDSQQIVKHFQHAFRGINTIEDYENTLVPLAAAKQLVVSGLQVLKEKQAYREAQQLAAAYKKITPPGIGAKEYANVAQAWAESLRRQAEGKTGPQADALKEEAQARWREAALACRTAANAADSDKNKIDLLWASIEAFTSAKDPSSALEELQGFLQLPLTAEQEAKAWFTLAESHRALGHKKQAEQAYYKCWEYEYSPYAYRARYQLAVEKIQTNQFEQAEDILRKNLDSKAPSIDRQAHQKSLYRFASLLYQQGHFSRAWLWLQEAARRYPDGPDVFLIRDLLGDCCRRLAAELHKKIYTKPNPLPASALAKLRENRIDWLEKAAKTYQELADDLKKIPERPAAQEKLYRKACFTKADSELDLNNYLEAVRWYKDLADRYPAQIEELIAYQRIWLCCLALEYQPEQLATALKAASAVHQSVKQNLSKVPDEFFEDREGAWTRQQWQAFVARLDSELPSYSTRVLKPDTP